MSVPLLRDARQAGWVTSCSICTSTMPRAQNRAAKGSTLMEDETLCPSGYNIFLWTDLNWFLNFSSFSPLLKLTFFLEIFFYLKELLKLKAKDISQRAKIHMLYGCKESFFYWIILPSSRIVLARWWQGGGRPCDLVLIGANSVQLFTVSTLGPKNFKEIIIFFSLPNNLF